MTSSVLKAFKLPDGMQEAIANGELVWSFNDPDTGDYYLLTGNYDQVMETICGMKGINSIDDPIPDNLMPHLLHFANNLSAQGEISLVEYCENNGISLSTARTAARENRIPGARKVGRNWVVSTDCTWEPKNEGWPAGQPRHQHRTSEQNWPAMEAKKERQ